MCKMGGGCPRLMEEHAGEAKTTQVLASFLLLHFSPKELILVSLCASTLGEPSTPLPTLATHGLMEQVANWDGRK